MENTTGLAKRTGYLAYGVVAYAIFLVAFLYAVGFVGNLWRPLGLEGPLFHSMDFGGTPAPLASALVIDALLLGLFAVQHSVMARQGFKQRWTKIVAPQIERSTFVLAASLCLLLLFWQWRPIATATVWAISTRPFAPLFVALCFAGFLIVLLATFMINHFDLFGLRQSWYAFRGQPYPGLRFSTPALYKAVRHPIYFGFIVAFWATPVMTIGHLVFAAATTGYILVAIQLEERDLVNRYGETYRQDRRDVWMLLPLPKRTRGALPGQGAAPGDVGLARSEARAAADG
jgi:methanethiol S-methyltransferase